MGMMLMNHRRSTCNRLFTLSFSSSFFSRGKGNQAKWTGVGSAIIVLHLCSSFFVWLSLTVLLTYTHTLTHSLCMCAVLACSSLLLPFSCAGVRCFSFLFCSFLSRSCFDRFMLAHAWHLGAVLLCTCLLCLLRLVFLRSA